MIKLYTAYKYSIFAVISTTLNLGMQWLTGQIYTGYYSLYISIFFGTVAGLLTKYYLDKKFIFFYYVENRIEDIHKFLFYTTTGILTTAIFWGFELVFHYFFQPEKSKYIGAVIGLSLGYYIKYLLDKKYVFRVQVNE